MSKKLGYWRVDLWSLQPGFPCIPRRCCVSWQQDADNGMLSLAERFTNKLEQPRFTWLPHYLAKAINLCGQACKAGLSVQIAHNQEMCVQLCMWPYWTQSWDSGIMDEWQWFVVLVWSSLYDLIIIIHYVICHFVDFEGLS